MGSFAHPEHARELAFVARETRGNLSQITSLGLVQRYHIIGPRIRFGLFLPATGTEHTVLVHDAHQSSHETFDLEERVSLHVDREQVRVLAG